MKSRSTWCARICLHEHKIDHIAHLCPAQAAGIGTLLGLKQEVIYQAVQQAVHVSFTTRQSRKGEISVLEGLCARPCRQAGGGSGGPRDARRGRARARSMKARIPSSPGCWTARTRVYQVPLPAPGEAKRAILDSYTKEHSARISEPGADRPRLPHARADRGFRRDREDRHPYLASYPLRHRHRRQRPAEDGPEGQPRNARPFDHVYLRRRACRTASGTTRPATRRSAPAGADTVRLWHKIETREDPEWTRRYHSLRHRREGVRRARRDLLARTARSWWTNWRWPTRIRSAPSRSSCADYIRKFRTLTDGIITHAREQPVSGSGAEPAEAGGGRAAAG